jgi:hypothetical protein
MDVDVCRVGTARAEARAAQEKNAGKMPAPRAAKTWMYQGNPNIAIELYTCADSHVSMHPECRGGPLWPPIRIAPVAAILTR